MTNLRLTASVWSEEGGWVARCVELNVTSQGETETEALRNLREAVELFMECADQDEVSERLHLNAHVHAFEAVCG
jgi:predicted RNase H-like HicB family nuclease